MGGGIVLVEVDACEEVLDNGFGRIVTDESLDFSFVVFDTWAL